MVWVDPAPDNTGVAIEILPAGFNPCGFCLKCGGGIQVDYTCSRCNADYWPAVKRSRNTKLEGKADG